MVDFGRGTQTGVQLHTGAIAYPAVWEVCLDDMVVEITSQKPP